VTHPQGDYLKDLSVHTYVSITLKLISKMRMSGEDRIHLAQNRESGLFL
jgi:hypothetical protein